jgi:CubicO group peptidase (beta-lactamase class C family)
MTGRSTAIHDPGRRSTLERTVAATLDDYLADGSVPGVAVAVTDLDGLVLERTGGWRDVAARRPVDGATLFEIGSIGKAFTAFVVLQLAAEGRLDIDDPVVRHLPWFRVPRTGARITIGHLLGHTSGITAGVDGTPEATFQVWRLRSLPPGSAPGRRFHYSNVGYKTLGLVIEAIEGRPYPEVIRSRVLEPAGMTASEPAITHATRDRLAIGYEPARDDVPLRPGDPLAPATWLTTATADGSVAATAADLAAFARLLMTDRSGIVERMATPGTASGADGYGYALVRRWHGRVPVGDDLGPDGRRRRGRPPERAGRPPERARSPPRPTGGRLARGRRSVGGGARGSRRIRGRPRRSGRRRRHAPGQPADAGAGGGRRHLPEPRPVDADLPCRGTRR